MCKSTNYMSTESYSKDFNLPYTVTTAVYPPVPAYTNQRFSGSIISSKGLPVYIKRVIYNNPATIIIWSDDTRTVSKIHNGDTYSQEIGLILCVLKKSIGTTNVNALIEDWVPEQMTMDFCQSIVTLADVRKKNK